MPASAVQFGQASTLPEPRANTRANPSRPNSHSKRVTGVTGPHCPFVVGDVSSPVACSGWSWKEGSPGSSRFRHTSRLAQSLHVPGRPQRPLTSHGDCCDDSPSRPRHVLRSIRYRLTAISISGRAASAGPHGRRVLPRCRLSAGTPCRTRRPTPPVRGDRGGRRPRRARGECGCRRGRRRVRH
jgi:hypothetical protein